MIKRISPSSSDCQTSLKVTRQQSVLMADRILGRGIVRDQLRYGDGGNLGETATSLAVLMCGKCLPENAKDQFLGRRLGMVRHRDEVYAMVLGCDWGKTIDNGVGKPMETMSALMDASAIRPGRYWAGVPMTGWEIILDQ